MINFLEKETFELQKIIKVLQDFEQNFESAKKLAQLLGVHCDAQKTTFVFWTPKIVEMNHDAFLLEIFTPQTIIDFKKIEQVVDFQLFTFNLKQLNEISFGVFEGINIGNENQIGDFYDLIYFDKKNQKQRIADPLAYSIPFGAFSPAEVFDIQSVTRNRKDGFYLKNLEGKVKKPANILEIHIPTASEGGTLSHLSDFYKKMKQNIDNQGIVSDFEKAFLGYDAIELMPLQALSEHENKPPFWQETHRNGNLTKIGRAHV